MAENKGAFSIGGKTIELPVKEGTMGPAVVDIRNLYADTGMFTFDPGFTSTASCESKITFIDGDAGVLLYRGYPIEQLAEHGDFLETCYLLLYGELPSAAEKANFDYRITRHTMVHEQMARFFQGFRRDAHPMAVMVAAAALPMGANVFLFSQRYSVAQELITASVAVSTALALLTLTIALMLVS